MASETWYWLCTETGLDSESCPTFCSTDVPASQGAQICRAEVGLAESEQHSGLFSWDLLRKEMMDPDSQGAMIPQLW